jgi:hypothetical protein
MPSVYSNRVPVKPSQPTQQNPRVPSATSTLKRSSYETLRQKNLGEGLCDGDIRMYSAKTKIEGEKHFSTCEQTVNE